MTRLADTALSRYTQCHVMFSYEIAAASGHFCAFFAKEEEEGEEKRKGKEERKKEEKDGLLDN